MKKPAIALMTVLAAGLAVAAVIVGMPDYGEPATTIDAGAPDTGDGIEERLLALEAALGAERKARQLLEDELLVLYDALETLEGAAPPETRSPGEFVRNPRHDPRTPGANPGRSDQGRRLTALAEAGFSVDRADWILKRESELRMEAMQARYAAMRSGEQPSPLDRPLTPDGLLRVEIGDAEFEMYLRANERPTSVGVRRVLDASPALSAGLQAGDRITHYDGERVFSTFDLTQQAIRGEAGENVVVNFIRDGMAMQVVVPRGPLGISTGRR